MITSAIQRLEQYIAEKPSHFRLLDEAELEFKPTLEKWSKKEIFGHLIDSATNNLTRFISGQFEDNPIILYDQDQWCKHNYYQVADFSQMIALWESLNRQLVFVWKQLSSEALQRKANDHTLAFLAEDYVSHLEHHLNQIAE